MRIAVIGLGSVLMGDDALGPFVIRRLQASYDFPAQVDLLDLGTPGPEFAGYLTGYQALIVIDTVKDKGEPGTLHRYDRSQLARVVPNPRMSPHDPNLREAILTADFAGTAPQTVVLLGMVPAVVALGTELSAAVQKALPDLETKVLEELVRLGMTVTAKEEVESLDIWWER